MSGERILVIDDSTELRTFLCEELLPAAGFRALPAADGDQALKAIAAEQPDLIMLDNQLPDTTGLAILQELENQGLEIPVVFMTAHGTESVAVEAFRKGAREYLAKPFDVEIGLATIERVLAQVRLEREKETLSRDLEQAQQNLKQRVNELTVLFGVSKSVTSQLDLDKVLQRVVEAATFITRAEEGALWLSEPDTGELFLRADRGLGQERAQLLHLTTQDSSVGDVLNSSRPARRFAGAGADGIEIKPGYVVQALLAVPLVIKGQSIGVLSVANRVQSHAFDPNNEAMLGALADYTAIAIENVRAYQATDLALTQRVEELSYLYQITRTVTSTLDQEKVFDRVAARIGEMFQVEAGSLLLLDEDAQELVFVTTWLGSEEPLRGLRLKLGQGIAGQVALLREPAIVNDAYNDSRFYSEVDQSTGFVTRSILCVPLLVKERCIGVVELLNKVGGSFTDEDVERLSNVARPVAIALENARLYGESQKLHEAQRRFVTTIAQELRSPLTAIKGYSDMLLATANSATDATWIESIEKIGGNAEHLITLMEDLLDISSLESGDTQLELAAVPLKDMVAQISAAFEQRLKDKNLRLSVKLPSRLPAVWVDQERIKQVLGSLLGNAYLYTLPKGRISITAQLQQGNRAELPEAASLMDILLRKRSESGWVAVSVEDTGIGIVPEDQPQVFERFFRSEHPLVQFHSGRGLSLSIARSLVELHGGHIWFETEPGQGTTFTFTLPVAVSSQ